MRRCDTYNASLNHDEGDGDRLSAGIRTLVLFTARLRRSPSVRGNRLSPADRDLVAATGGAAPLASYAFSGKILTGLSLALGLVHAVFLGLGGALLDVSWPSGPELLPWLAAALLVVVPSHEGLHALAAKCLGHRPILKIELPRIFTTLSESLPRNHVVLIALTPLLALNTLAFALFFLSAFRLFAALCLLLNTVGSAGDIWLAVKLLGHARDTRVLATEAGVEVRPHVVVEALEQPRSKARASSR